MKEKHNNQIILRIFVAVRAFFSIMQNKTDKGTSLVSKSLPVANSNSVNRLFSARKINSNVLSNAR